jgi:taurine dioxygenase
MDIASAVPARSTLRVTPYAPAVGAWIDGVDVSRPLSDGDLRAMRAALAEHGVVFLRGQHLSPEQHLAFARQWGAINVNRFFAAVPGYPEIAEVRKEPEQRSNIGGGWHTDHSYDLAPAMGSILLAREVPPLGGDTLFAHMGRAFDALSEGLKTTLRGLRAVHSSRHVFGRAGGYAAAGDVGTRIGNPELATQDVVHPVVLRHPDSGQEVLFVNRAFTTHFEGWSVQDSAPLLQHLYQHAGRPEFSCRFQWAEGSIAFWDNRSTWHYALNDYHGARRVMHRITVEGVPLPGSATLA